MGFNCGIVGLPNVGKSTLFNALTETAAAEAANYPFCTIEPNTGRVAVPDLRLSALAALASSKSIIPTYLEFVDIAGLVRGASKGEGLGNQFLGNIREVDAIAHVLRCFEDSEITHVDGDVDPVRDAATVETELMLADIDSLERRMAALVKKSRGGDKESKADLALMEKIFAHLSDGLPARSTKNLTDDETLRLPQLQLLTAKPVLYVCNVAEGDERDTDKDAVRFFYIAKGSVAELITQLEIAKDAQLIDPSGADALIKEAEEIDAMLGALIKARGPFSRP